MVHFGIEGKKIWALSLTMDLLLDSYYNHGIGILRYV